MDQSILEDNFHMINNLTVIASESYDSFASSLQNEMVESLSDRPSKLTIEWLMNKEIIDLCMQINANNKCDSCSGRFNNHTCIYCGNESTILKELENKLIYILQNNFILNSPLSPICVYMT